MKSKTLDLQSKMYTQDVINYFESSKTRSLIILELYYASLDNLTFSYHIQYYVADKSNFKRPWRSLSKPTVDWWAVTRYFIDKFTNLPVKPTYTSALLSYYQDLFASQPQIRGSSRYIFRQNSLNNGKQFTIYLNDTRQYA
tara:strand:+ start:2658 stop:3080 length:423 start_codon:yes stop_codon:yes gene_type:complete